MADLITIKDRVYENRRLKVDGGRFVRCRFIKSKIIYSATQEVSFEDCEFEECDWIFEDAAERALLYLSMLLRHGGPEGQAVVAATIDALHSDPLMESITAVSAAS